MANEGEEEYEIPSAARKKEVELSRGVVLLPPERMKKIEQEAREEEKEIAKKREEEKVRAKSPIKEEKKIPITRPGAGAGLTPSIANVLAIFAILIALVAIGFSYLTLNSYNQMRIELKGVIEDLKAFKATNISINAELTAEHVVKEEIALRDILDPVSFPISKVMEVSGEVLLLNPSTRIYESAPYTGNLTVTGSIDIDPSLLDPSKKMRLNYTIPGKGAMIINIPAGHIWSSDLDDLISRLEKIVK